MIDNFLIIFIAISFAAVALYPVRTLHNKRLGYFSVLQVLYLVFVPALLIPLVFFYAFSLTDLPVIRDPFISDQALLILLILSICFVYGGVAIHAVAKMMSHTDSAKLRYEDSELAQMNRFFHLSFSHNLFYSGLVVAVFSLVLLEINHVPLTDQQGLVNAIVKGFVLGVTLVLTLFFYTRSDDDYRGRWNDLRYSFIVLWIMMLVVLVMVRRTAVSLTDYQLLLPALFGGALVGFLNIALVVRRLKRGGFQVRVRWKRLKELIFS